jgi:hypothetical protein
MATKSQTTTPIGGANPPPPRDGAALLPLPWQQSTGGADTRLPPHLAARNVRHMSPREMAAFGMDLYVDGVLGYEDYALLAFQPELQSDFGTTIGALTGTAASPDRPRDYVRIWEERLRFEQDHSDEDRTCLQRTARILRLLQRWGTSSGRPD